VKLHVDWSDPIPMRLASRQGSRYLANVDIAPDSGGIYVFGRTHGHAFEALYVGKANSLRVRLDQQLNNLDLMEYVRQAKAGRRVIMVGALVTKRGQRVNTCLPILERAFIRYFLSQGHELANIHGTRRVQHEVASTGRPMHFVPLLTYIDKT
jgi:hypothetical protein